MGVQRLKELLPIVKEALHQTVRVAKFFCFLHVTGTTVCTPILLTGPSMRPTFIHGNIVFGERITVRTGNIGTGDVILVRSPENPRKTVCKRVKAVEGDVVTYLLDPKNPSGEEKTVVVMFAISWIPKGHIWVEGDNIHDSRDSKQFGAVPYGLLHARLYFQVWPLKDFGSIGNNTP